MTDVKDTNQVQEQKQNDKEYNFRAIEAKLNQERVARIEAEKKAEEALKIAQEAQAKRSASPQEEDEDDEPYIDKKKLEKKLARFGQSTQGDIQKAMEMAKESAKEELKQEMWLENNPDFMEVMEKHAESLYHKAPELAKNILKMPNNFDRQKLVYNAIKSMGLDKPETKQSSVQDKIDANRKSPYYQPSGVGAAPYAAVGDFSQQGQKNAYAKMKELQSKLRM